MKKNPHTQQNNKYLTSKNRNMAKNRINSSFRNTTSYAEFISVYLISSYPLLNRRLRGIYALLYKLVRIKRGKKKTSNDMTAAPMLWQNRKRKENWPRVCILRCIIQIHLVKGVLQFGKEISSFSRNIRVEHFRFEDIKAGWWSSYSEPVLKSSKYHLWIPIFFFN